MIKVVMMTKEPPDDFHGACAVYRAKDINGVFLYVGASSTPHHRIKSHSTTSKWFKDAVAFEIFWHKSREGALTSEAISIAMLKPKFNKASPKGRIADAIRLITSVKIKKTGKVKERVATVSLVAEPYAPAVMLIKQWAKSEGRKLGWLAAQIPVHQGDLSRWLKSKQMPREVYRIRLSDITGLDVRDKALWGNVE